MEPFSRDTHGTKWTSTTVRDTTTFGYTYPETQTNNRADTISQINKLYGAGFQKSGGLGSTIHRRGDSITTNNNTNEEQNVYAANPATTSDNDDDANAKAHGFEIQGRQRRYSADLISNKHALVDGSYAIYLFVGDFDKENPRGWALERNLAGTHVAFSRMGNNETNGSGSGSGDGNDGHSAVVTGGRVPLTNILRDKVRRGELESLEEESVERYLRGNLHWRAAKVSFFFLFLLLLHSLQSIYSQRYGLLTSCCGKNSSTIHPSLSKTFPIYPLLSAWLKSRRLLTRMNYPRERILKNWLGLRRGGKEVVEKFFF